MQKILRTDYWQDTKLKAQFIAFLDHIFGLNLTKWDDTGYWDYDNYHPFTYFENDRIISHVCLFSMDTVINGRRTRLAQISGVGTLEEYRRRGLNRELTETAIAWAKKNHDFFFLFSDPDAVPFYQKCGFRPVREHKFTAPIVPRPPLSGIVKLCMNDAKDRDKIFALASRRAPVSDQWGVIMPNLFMFWCLYVLSNSVFYIPELDCLVLFEHKDNRIIIYDIVAEHMPEFSAIVPYISSESSTKAEFLFMVDKLNLSNLATEPADEDNNTHFLGTCPIENKPFIIPITAHA